MKRTKLKPGDILKVPLDAIFFTYARVLNFSDIALYNFQIEKDLTIINILKGDVLFKVRVYLNEIPWDKVGTFPLEENLQHSIYWIDEVASSLSLIHI